MDIATNDMQIVSKPTCFVAMPIKSPGTDEHKHFSAVYENIAEVVVQAGYITLRADKVSSPGNITKDIVTRLAEAELVIVDLTDLNPNVFYEAGIRHALRRFGTILLIDKTKSPVIPFDLGQYRIIQYESDLSGIRALRENLRVTIENLSAVGVEGSVPTDSPLHDWYPELPTDLIEHSRQEIAPDVASEIAHLRRQVSSYRDQLARHERTAGAPHSDLRGSSLIQQLRQAAEAGELLQDYLSAAATAVQEQNVTGFLDATEALFRTRDAPDTRVYLRFSEWANVLGLQNLGLSILEEGSVRWPNEPDMRRMMTVALSRSTTTEGRTRAKQAFAETIGLEISQGEVTGEIVVNRRASEIGHLLEILHGEAQDDVGLVVIERAIAAVDNATSPADRASIERDYARQLDWLDRPREALERYEACVTMFAHQEGLRWFANFLHNHGWHTEACELFALEAFFDLDDANGFLHVADEISYQLYDYFALKIKSDLSEVLGTPRDLPAGIGAHTIHAGIRAAVSCGNLNQANRSTLENLIRRADIADQEFPPMTKNERLRWVVDVYSYLSSERTAKNPVAQRLLKVKESALQD